MEREPYRRYRTSENTYEREEETGSRGETLILQGIISGVMLLIVLLISIIRFAPLEPVQSSLRNALSGPETAAELLGGARQFGADVLGWQWLEGTPPAP